MKKLLIAFFVFGISTQIFAKITVKQMVGTWNYTVQTDQGDLTGSIKFTKEKKGLSGEVITDEGNIIPILKIEIKENNILRFEIQPDYETMVVTLTIDGDEYKGVGSTGEGEVTIFGKKQK